MLNSPILLGNVESYWIFTSTENQCWRYGKVVYIPILKTASTYYASILERNGWQSCGLDSVDWSTDSIFGFIMDPVQRYLKALTEDALVSAKHKSIIEKTLDLGTDHCCLLTHHALPMSLTLGDLMYHVYWIPIDSDISPDKMLIEFCYKHGLQLHLDFDIDVKHRHQSSKHQLDIFRSLRDRFDTGNAHFYRVFAKDIDLYRNICATVK